MLNLCYYLVDHGKCRDLVAVFINVNNLRFVLVLKVLYRGFRFVNLLRNPVKLSKVHE